MQRDGTLTGAPVNFPPGDVITGRTLAQLQAMGTQQGIVVGIQAIDPTTGLLLEALTPVGANASSWGTVQRRSLNPSPYGSSVSAALRFISWASTTGGTLPDQAGMAFDIKFLTRILGISIFVENAWGATEVSVWQNGGAMPIEAVSQVIPAATTTLFPFTAVSTLDPGDFLSIGTDPTNARTNGENECMSVEIEEVIPVAA